MTTKETGRVWNGGVLLTDHRKMHGVDQKIMAQQTGVHVSTYRHYENNTRRPSSGYLARFAETCHLEADETTELFVEFGESHLNKQRVVPSNCPAFSLTEIDEMLKSARAKLEDETDDHNANKIARNVLALTKSNPDKYGEARAYAHNIIAMIAAQVASWTVLRRHSGIVCRLLGQDTTHPVFQRARMNLLLSHWWMEDYALFSEGIELYSGGSRLNDESAIAYIKWLEAQDLFERGNTSDLPRAVDLLEASRSDYIELNRPGAVQWVENMLNFVYCQNAKTSALGVDGLQKAVTKASEKNEDGKPTNPLNLGWALFYLARVTQEPKTIDQCREIAEQHNFRDLRSRLQTLFGVFVLFVSFCFPQAMQLGCGLTAPEDAETLQGSQVTDMAQLGCGKSVLGKRGGDIAQLGCGKSVSDDGESQTQEALVSFPLDSLA